MNPPIYVGWSSRAAVPDGVRLFPFSAAALPRDASDVVLRVNACSSSSGYMQLRQSDFNAFLERGARVTLVFGGAKLASGGIESKFFQWLSQKLGPFVSSPLTPGKELQAARPETKAWFSEQSAAVALSFFGELEAAVEPLATIIQPNGDPTGIGAARWKVGRATVIAIPHRHADNLSAVADVQGLLAALPASEECPAYLEALDLADESSIRAELGKLDSRKLALEAELERYRRLKRILYASGADLERAVVSFLNDELGLSARHEGSGRNEDFWLLDTGGVPWAIGEVKSGERRNIDRTDIAKLLIHRSEAGQPEDFPGLLVANTFYRLQSMSERDHPPAPNVISRATADHVVILRTLDLVRMKQRQLHGIDSGVSELQTGLRDGGGWFEVDANLEVSLRQG